MTKISIITPSYNQGQFIEATIQSVLQQSVPADEYIIIDGLSTDATPDILRQYQNQIKITSEKDRGQTDALNKGFKQAQHDIIGWLNSDDVYPPGTLETIKNIFTANPSIELVYGNAMFIDAQGKKIGHYPVQSDPNSLLLDCTFCQPAVFFKRSLLEKYGDLNTQLNFCMDYEFWLRLLQNKVNMLHVPKTLALQRLHADCKTVDKALEANQEVCELYQRYQLPAPLHRVIKLAWIESHQSSKKFSALDFFHQVKTLCKKYQASWQPESLWRTMTYLTKRVFCRIHG